MSEFLNLTDAKYVGTGKYDIPVMQPVTELYIKDWIGFNYVATTKKNRQTTGVNFYLWDHQFERVWNYPKRFAQVLNKFGCVIAPDFSTYIDFPRAVQIYNHYRSQWCGVFWQQHGATVVPNIQFSDEDSYDWCFDGVPEGGIVAISNVGCMNNKESRQLFMKGYNEMLTRIQPKEVLFFAHLIDDYKGPAHYIKYKLDKSMQGEE